MSVPRTRFRVGDAVRWIGIAASCFCGETAVVLEVRPNARGIELMDEYVVLSSNGYIGTYYAGELGVVPPAPAPLNALAP